MLTATNYKYRNFTTSKIACFISVDPLQFKYPVYTPFQYAGNKPVSFIDLDGAELWITYLNENKKEEKVRFENGKVYNVDGSDYKGDNKFVLDTANNLNIMSEVDDGKKLLDHLSNSKYKYDLSYKSVKYEGALAKFDPNKKEGGGELYIGKMINEKDMYKKFWVFAHELFHAYQYDHEFESPYSYEYDNYTEKPKLFMNSVQAEVEAYIYGTSIALNTTNSWKIKKKFGVDEYDNATVSIIYSGFDEDLLKEAIKHFKFQSFANAEGIYSDNIDGIHEFLNGFKNSYLQDFNIKYTRNEH